MTNIPYKLPNGWKWLKLGDVCNYERRTIDPRRYPKQEFLVFSIPAYDNNKQPELLKGFQIKSAKLSIKPNVCLFSKLNPRIPRVWVIKGDEIFSEAQMLTSTEFMPLIPNPQLIDLDYLGMVLLSKSFLIQLQLEVSGATGSRQRLKPQSVLEALIPLPPLEEQKRIVARIEELMTRIKEARKLRQESKEKTELLWQSALAETFPKPGTQLPNGWKWVKLGEIFEVQQGVSMSPRRRLGRNPIPFLRTSNILWGSIDLSSIDEMDFTDEEVKKLCLQPGDLLVCEGGEVGRTAIWEGQLPLVLYQNHIHRLRRFSDQIEPRFFMYWMQAAYQVFQHYQGAESRTAIPNLSGSRLKQFIVPFPPLEEQKRIVVHLQALQEKIKSLKESQTHTETKLKELENSILDKAFKGEL